MNLGQLITVILILNLTACSSGQFQFQIGNHRAFCKSDLDCPAMEVCTMDQSCQLRIRECQSASDCTSSENCIEGICLFPERCLWNSQCPSEMICEQFRCVSNRCETDLDCLGNQVCNPIDGICREAPCQNSSECGEGLCCGPWTHSCVDEQICEYFENGVPTDCEPSDELCDQFDNDCDGLIDEDFQDLGKLCEVGSGICLRLGNQVCSQDGSTSICNANPGSPEPELCDGLDNDCDGGIDENC